MDPVNSPRTALGRRFPGRSVLGGVLIVLSLLATRSTSAQTLTALAFFNGMDGSSPQAGLTLAGNTLYGTTPVGGNLSLNGGGGWGAVFSVPVSGGTPTVLASFNASDGYGPQAGLTLSGNTLYGTASGGGNLSLNGGDGYGTVFSLPVSGGTPTVLASFNGIDGAAPTSALTLVGNKLYGTTQGGGAYGDGTVFSVPASGGNPTVLGSFNGSNGEYPTAGLTLSGNTLYGTASGGGANGYGTVFSVPVSGGTPTVLASFNDSDGYDPQAGLTLSGNTLYGTTFLGGNLSLDSGLGEGTVFSVPVSGGTPTVLAAFSGSDGFAPVGGLTLSGNSLYGTTVYGGATFGTGLSELGLTGGAGIGEIFSIPVSGGNPTVLGSFNGSNGGYPQAGLTLSGGTLYGTARSYGTLDVNKGTVFALNLAPAPIAWSSSGGGSWNTPSNWTSGTVPSGDGSQVVLGASATTPSTITLDGNQTVGTLTFNNTASYTLAPGSGGTLTLNNSGGTGGSQLLVLAGSHTINAPVTIAGGNLTVTESSNSSLLISSNINDDNNAESLTLNGDGTGRLILSGANTYGGGTIVEDGMLVITSAYALPDGTSLTLGAGATLVFDSTQTAGPITASLGVSSAEVAAVPEPGTLALLIAGAALLAMYRRRR